MKSVVADLTLYDWEGDTHKKKSAKTVTYEMHVGGLTCNPNSMIDASKRGTYTGLIEKIAYIVDFGVTALNCFLFFNLMNRIVRMVW